MPHEAGWPGTGRGFRTTGVRGQFKSQDLAPHCVHWALCYADGHFQGVCVGKILLLIVIGLVVYALIRNYRRSLDKPAAPGYEQTVEDMVKCAHCGVNLPRSEAIYSSGDFFCTPEHKLLGKK
jgi:uncharacterized protein